MKKTFFKKLENPLNLNILFALIVFLSFAIMVVASVVFVDNIVDRQTNTIAKETLNKMAISVDDNIFAKKLLFTDISRGVKRLDINSYNNKEVQSCLIDIQKFYTSSDSPFPDFLKVYGYINGEFLVGSGWAPTKEFIPTERPWYKDALLANGGVAFSEPYIDAETGKMCISFSQIVAERNGQFDVVAIDLTLESIIEKIYDQQISGNGYVFFLGNEFNFLVHKNKDYLKNEDNNLAQPEPMTAICEDYAKIETMLKNGEDVSAVRIKDYDGVDSLVFAKALFNGWHIGTIIPRSDYISDSVNLGIVIGILGVILSTLLSAILIYTNRKMERFREESTSKSAFLARASHELRTPMNAIIGMTEIAKNTIDPQKVKYCLDKINIASLHLLEIINNLLDMSKIESGQFYLLKENVYLDDLLTQIKTVNDPKADIKEINFTIQVSENVPKLFFIDGPRLLLVIDGLINNAIKFTSKGGNVSLKIDLEKQFENHCLLNFEVEDNGIGITKDALDKLFIAFEQADGSISRNFGGVGLGLPIAQNIIKMMGGEIGVDSTPSKGSRFYFSILVETSDIDNQTITEATGEDTVKATKEGLFKGKKLLLVEDVEINREIMCSLLEDTMIEIDIAENGLIAVEKFSASPDKYDIVFMDIHMPEMDGITATKMIREMDHPRAKTIPIIALTADLLKENVDAYIDSGMNTYTGKPVDIDIIISFIEKYTH